MKHLFYKCLILIFTSVLFLIFIRVILLITYISIPVISCFYEQINVYRVIRTVLIVIHLIKLRKD